MRNGWKTQYLLLPLFSLFFVLFQTGCGLLSMKKERELEKSLFNLVNRHRQSLNLPDFEWNDTIAEQCRIHSRDMLDGRVLFGHTGLEQRMARISLSIPVEEIRENVAYLSDTMGLSDPANTVFQEWLKSATHRHAIEGNFDLSGVGAARKSGQYYFTQIYIRSR